MKSWLTLILNKIGNKYFNWLFSDYRECDSQEVEE